MMRKCEQGMNGGTLADLERRLSGDLTSLDDFARELSELAPGRMAAPPIREEPGTAVSGDASAGGIPGRINADPATVEQGLAKLVLSLIELLRRLMEKQA